MQLKDLIRTRRTIGAFTPQPVDPAQISALLETAIWTPNHRLTEPWRFVIITGEGVTAYANIRRAMVVESSRSADESERQKAGDGTYAKFAAIPAYLVVIQKLAADPEIREEDYAACAALIQNFLLLAWEKGIGTAWKTFKNDPRLRALIGLSEDEKVVGIIHIGYPDESPTCERSPIHERITIIDHNTAE